MNSRLSETNYAYTEQLSKNPDLDLLIEVHPKDGFLKGEFHFPVSRLIGKSRFRF